jgi:hypothetical protein
MTCKYFDSGWCYAPKDVKNNSVQGGCFEPEYCATYLMQNKTPMTEKEHLECEIKELELELEEKGAGMRNLINILSRRQQKLKEMNDTQRNTNEAVENKLKEEINKLQSDNWSMSMNHRTPYKPQVEYYDEQTVIINGVQYQRVEPPKPPTLYKVLAPQMNSVGFYFNEQQREWICNVVRGWLMSAEPNEIGVYYGEGWEDCIKHLRENIK